MTAYSKLILANGYVFSTLISTGMFIAKISKGRTIREFINGTMTAPIAFSFIWFSIFGGMLMVHQLLSDLPPF